MIDEYYGYRFGPLEYRGLRLTQRFWIQAISRETPS
jgi:UDP-galactopyranose mutase